MKKSYILGLVCFFGLFIGQIDSSAQYKKGDVILNPGIGLGYWYGGSGYSGGLTAGFSINAEFSCILDDIAIGPYLALTRRSYNYAGFSDYNQTYIDFGARGTYHFGRLLKVNNQFDPYAGVFLGFVVAGDNADGNNPNRIYNNRVQTGVYAGARYYFSDKFGVFGEVGVGMYPITLGVTFKLK